MKYEAKAQHYLHLGHDHDGVVTNISDYLPSSIADNLPWGGLTALRGGNFVSFNGAGVFTLTLATEPVFRSRDIGFRCVFRP